MMVPFFQEHGCHKLCVLKKYEKTFPDLGKETIWESRKGKEVKTLRPRIWTIMSKHWRTHLWYWK